MKICIINSLYEPFNRGGAEVVVKKIANGLAETHTVFIITLGKKKEIQKQKNILIYRINPINIFSFINISQYPIIMRAVWHVLDVFNFSGYWQVKKILLYEKPDVVMTHNLKGIGYLSVRAIKKSRINHIHTVHDVQLSRPSGLLLYGFEKPFFFIDKFYEKACRFLFGSPDVVISPSRWLLQYYLRRGFFRNSKTDVIPNPVEIKKVKDDYLALLPQSVVNILYVGQIERYKGVLFFIDACKNLTVSDWHVTIIGSGGAAEEVAVAIRNDDHFTYAGRVESEKLAQYYRKADMTVVPSFCYENSPTVIFESLAANIPVIAADIGGIPEIIKDNYNGFTFAPGSKENLIKVLEHFISHPEKRKLIKKNCFVSVLPFSTNNYIKRLEGYFSNGEHTGKYTTSQHQ